MDVVRNNANSGLRNSPKSATLDGSQYYLYVIDKIQRGLADAESNRVFTQDEIEKRFLKRKAT